MERNYETELREQQTFVLLWKAGNLGYFLVISSICASGHSGLFLIGLVLQMAFNAVKWPPIKQELEYRKKAIAFKQQFENLYVFSLSPDDAYVSNTFEEALAMLRQVGNTHEVRVHMAIFQDVCYFTAWFDSQGRRHDERQWRPDGSGFETWEQYQTWTVEFCKIDRDKRLRQIRGDNTGKQWVDQKIFQQNGKAEN